MNDVELIKRFDALEGSIGKIDKRFDILEQSIDKRFDEVEESIDAVAAITAKNFVELEERFDSKLTNGLTSLEERLGAKIDGVQRSVDGAYERQGVLETRISKIETALHIA